MIKEKKKNKENKKSIGQIFLEYLRTIFISILFSVVVTTYLTIHARNEMIKNLYKNPHEQARIDQQIAKRVIEKSDLIESLPTKSYAVCMQVGNLYEAAGDYERAQYAYNLAVNKSKPGKYNAQGKLVSLLILQGKYDEANKVLNSISDDNLKSLINFKTRAYIEMGDKYYSVGKTLKASQSYENAQFYYNKFSKKDKHVEKAINERLINSYIATADILVKHGLSIDAVKFLKKARKYAPKDYRIQYKLALIYADSDPLKSVELFEHLFETTPQNIDYTVYSAVLMKAANIEDLSGHPVKAKYYRYKVHSVDLFVNNKVVYKDDIDIFCTSFSIRKFMFKYHLKGKYKIKNISANDIVRLSVDFVLRQGDKEKERYTFKCADKHEPLLSNGSETPDIEVNFGKGIFTKKELEQYVIDIYVYKDEKFKTLFGSYSIPKKSF